MNPIIHITADSQNQTILGSILQEKDHLYVLPDTLIDGPLKQEEGTGLDTVRNQYFANINAKNGKIFTESTGNVETIMEVSTALKNNDSLEVIFWMSGNTTDVLGYFFTLHFLRTYYQRIHVINIAGLPFLDDDFKLFFPTKIAVLPISQISKALKLKRNITASEMETDGEEWKKIRDENAAIRLLDGNKRIKGVNEDHFDHLLKSIHKSGSKISRTLQIAYSKHNLELSAAFMESRLHSLSMETTQNSDIAPEDGEEASIEPA